jgi:hypothetical protein
MVTTSSQATHLNVLRLGQHAEAAKSAGGLHDVAAVRARARLSWATHPANSDGFTPGPHLIAQRREKRNALASAIHRLPPLARANRLSRLGGPLSAVCYRRVRSGAGLAALILPVSTHADPLPTRSVDPCPRRGIDRRRSDDRRRR